MKSVSTPFSLIESFLLCSRLRHQCQTHTRANTHTHTHTHACTNTHTHTHTCTNTRRNPIPHQSTGLFMWKWEEGQKASRCFHWTDTYPQWQHIYTILPFKVFTLPLHLTQHYALLDEISTQSVRNVSKIDNMYDFSVCFKHTVSLLVASCYYILKFILIAHCPMRERYTYVSVISTCSQGYSLCSVWLLEPSKDLTKLLPRRSTSQPTGWTSTLSNHQ